MRKIHITVKDTNKKDRKHTKSASAILRMDEVDRYFKDYGINLIVEAVVAANEELNTMTGTNVFVGVPATGSTGPNKLHVLKDESARVHDSSIISKLLRETPITTKLNVLFQMKWLSMNIIPDRHATEEEVSKACVWAKDMVNHVLEETGLLDIQLRNEQLKSEHDYLLSEIIRRHKLLLKSTGQERETVIRDLLMGLPTE